MASGSSVNQHKAETGPLDEGSVAALYEAHGDTIFRKCLALSCGDVAWAEDVTHDVFIRLLEHRGTVDMERNVGGWLRTVAFRLCVDRLRRERSVWWRIKQMLIASDRGAFERGPDLALNLKTKLERANDLLKDLPPKQRTVVFMKHFDGLSQHEISRSLGWSEGYVSKLLARATARLQAAGWEVANE